MAYLTNDNIAALETKLATLKPEIERGHETPTTRAFTGIGTRLTLSIVASGVMVDNDVDELGTVHRGNTAPYRRLVALVRNGVNAANFDIALAAGQYGAWLPKLTFKRRMGFAVWNAIEIMAKGVHADDIGHTDYVEPDAFAKYWLEVYADVGLTHVHLADPETVGTLDYLISKGKLTAGQKTSILAV